MKLHETWFIQLAQPQAYLDTSRVCVCFGRIETKTAAACVCVSLLIALAGVACV